MRFAPPKITLSYASNLFILYNLLFCNTIFKESAFLDISSNCFGVIFETLLPFIDFKGCENISLKILAL